MGRRSDSIIDIHSKSMQNVVFRLRSFRPRNLEKKLFKSFFCLSNCDINSYQILVLEQLPDQIGS
jgi:hypothetical protein